jgi:hypothetical protein
MVAARSSPDLPERYELARQVQIEDEVIGEPNFQVYYVIDSELEGQVVEGLVVSTPEPTQEAQLLRLQLGGEPNVESAVPDCITNFEVSQKREIE